MQDLYTANLHNFVKEILRKCKNQRNITDSEILRLGLGRLILDKDDMETQ